MKKLFSARSPIWQMITYIVGFGLFAQVTFERESGERYLTHSIWGLIVSLVLVALGITYFGLIAIYNYKNLDNRIRFWGMMPPELDEQDEAFRHFTYQAIRRVYIYYASIIPLPIIAYFIFTIPQFAMIILLGAILIGHYILYWASVWPVRYLEDEEQ